MGREDATADAAAAAEDAGLDQLVRQVLGARFGGKKVDVTLPVAMLYFGRIALSELMRLKLGKLLTGKAGWPALLAQAEHPALHALAPAGAAGIPVAEGASMTVVAAIADPDMFHDEGERKNLLNQFNALCAKACGWLKVFAHGHLELALPAWYAESFFERGGTESGRTHSVW